MKHLDPRSLANLADGALASPDEAAHLRSCRDCRQELAALRELCEALGQAPTPPPALREATLQRLGLRPRRSSGLLRWGWAPALGALALLLLLRGPAPVELATAPAQPKAAATAKPALRRQAPAALAQAPAPDQPTAAAPAAGVVETQAQSAAPALGQALEPTAVPESRVVAAPKATAVPAPEALKVQVRNNLIRPGQSLALTVELAQAGPFRAQVFDARGRLVETLYQGHAGPGTVYLHWDAAQAPAAAYTVLLQSGAQTKTFKAIVAH